jgi:hypothetical protein
MTGRPKLALALMVIATIAAGALMAYVIASAVTHTQDTAGAAAQKAGRASAQSCYETNTLLWHLDSASYAGFKRDAAAAAFLRTAAPRAFHKGSAVIAQLADVFDAAAQDGYWQPLIDCQQAAAHPGRGQLAIATPISSVPKQTIQQVLAHPPAPPTSG